MSNRIKLAKKYNLSVNTQTGTVQIDSTADRFNMCRLLEEEQGHERRPIIRDPESYLEYLADQSVINP